MINCVSFIHQENATINSPCLYPEATPSPFLAGPLDSDNKDKLGMQPT